MGTNYYLCKDVCPHCGRSDEQKHIGKSSGGWCFALHVYPSEGIYDLDDWKKLFTAKDSSIQNEYGEVCSPEAMLSIITQREWSRSSSAPPNGYNSLEAFHRANHAEVGPNGLTRHKIEQSLSSDRQSFTNGCIAHGAGTWDCLVGEFS